MDFAADGTWSSLVRVGVDWDNDKKFDILAVLANPVGAGEFLNYIEKKRLSPTHPGMTALPKGSQILSRLTVKRR